MCWVRRPLVKGETDWELVFGVFYIPLAALAAFVVTRLPGAWVPRCWLHALAGIPCPTCGACRAARALATGHPIEAWLTQPFLVTAGTLAAVFSAYSFFVVLGRRPRLRVEGAPRWAGKAVVFAVVALLLINWAYLVLDGR